MPMISNADLYYWPGTHYPVVTWPNIRRISSTTY